MLQNRLERGGVVRHAMHQGTFKELAGLVLPGELLFIHEPVGNTVALTRAGCAGRGRDRNPYLRVCRAQCRLYGPLADRRRTGQDNQPPTPLALGENPLI